MNSNKSLLIRSATYRPMSFIAEAVVMFSAGALLAVVIVFNL